MKKILLLCIDIQFLNKQFKKYLYLNQFVKIKLRKALKNIYIPKAWYVGQFIPELFQLLLPFVDVLVFVDEFVYVQFDVLFDVFVDMFAYVAVVQFHNQHFFVAGLHIYEYNVASVIQVDYVNDSTFKSTQAPLVQLQNISDQALQSKKYLQDTSGRIEHVQGVHTPLLLQQARILHQSAEQSAQELIVRAVHVLVVVFQRHYLPSVQTNQKQSSQQTLVQSLILKAESIDLSMHFITPVVVLQLLTSTQHLTKSQHLELSEILNEQSEHFVKVQQVFVTSLHTQLKGSGSPWQVPLTINVEQALLEQVESVFQVQYVFGQSVQVQAFPHEHQQAQ